MVTRLAGVLLVGTLAVLTAYRVAAWRDNVALWSAAVRVAPTARGWLNLGAALADQGEFDAARRAYARAAGLPHDAAISAALQTNRAILHRSDRHAW